jgi:glycosyltransferase involved in cell wall biosynthesis
MLWDKGVGEYVAAAREVRMAFPGATFRLLGFMTSDNPSAIPCDQINAWVLEGVVTYLGPTDDVRPHFADADCVVLPSYREGVPRVLLEAAAMGRPVITTDVPGCREAVVDGETGYLCRPADHADLANKLLKFIALPMAVRSAMGDRGRVFVERNFDERAVLERYLETVDKFGESVRPAHGV